MSNNDQNQKEKHNQNNNEKNYNIKSDCKVNRTHRISPSTLMNFELSKTEEKSDEEIQKKYNTARHFSTSYKQRKKEINDELYKEEIEKEKIKRKKIYKELKDLNSKLKIIKLLEDANINNLNNSSENGNYIYKKEKIYYYIINKTWFNQFKNYCQKEELSYHNINEDYPGQINNQHLILEDDTCLKLNTENRIIINSKYSDNCTCITPEMWDFLIKICGGGPEIKFLSNKSNNDISDNNEIDVIRKGVHIYLLFVPKKEIISNNTNKEPSNNLNNPLNPFQCQEIKKIVVNNESKNKINIQHIYFDITKNVQELINYINQILNQHRNKFTNTPLYFGPTFNSERNNCLVENINYRLWLNNLDISPEDLSYYITDQINKYEDADILMTFNKMDLFQDSDFKPYLLSSFIGNKIEDIFPNKYTKNFNNQDYYDVKYEDENLFPTMTIIIEEFPYHFSEPKKHFLIKKCNSCHYKDYVFSGCICQKVFYCSDKCKKTDFGNHMSSCKKGLIHFISQKNEHLYRFINGRKEYFENNKNEEAKFPILGLTNLGNSCYMNSSLQCIFAIKELTNYFLYYYKDEDLNKNNILGTGGALTLGYINLLLNINNTTNNEYYTPDIFKIILGLCSKKYEGNQQEDAHEFLIYLLDMLHEDLNKVTNKPTIHENNCNINNMNMSDEEKSLRDWNKFLKRNQSLLVDLFYGQYKSCVVCPQCNFKSVNFNSFLSLELPINENKNYILIMVCFIDHLKELPYIYFTIILYKNELKIYYLRKKIANLLNIDLLEFELAYVNGKNQIIHIYQMNEDIPKNLQCIYAYRINPKYFYSKNNERIREINNNNGVEDENIENLDTFNEDKYKIDYENLKLNINKRKKEIIKFNENKNRNDDYLYLTLKYNDNIGLNDSFFQRAILQSFIIKNKKTKNFECDSVIYLEKNKKCNDIYFEIFRKYFLNIAYYNIDHNKKGELIRKYNTANAENLNILISRFFNYYFKNAFFSPSELDLLGNFPDCPFVLFLKNEKYNIIQTIPFSSNLDYKDILDRFYHKIDLKKNQNNDDFDINEIRTHHFETRNNQLNNQNLNSDIYANIINNILLNNNINNNNEIENEKEKENEVIINRENTNSNINNINKININSNNDNMTSNNNIINNNNIVNNNSNNIKRNNGLPGGGNDNTRNIKNPENEKEENLENENNDNNGNNENNDNNDDNNENETESDEDSDTDNDNNNENNENSEQDTENENNSIQIDNLSLNSNSNSHCNTKKKKYKIDDIDDGFNPNDIFLDVKFTEKVENIDKILIMWNRNYIRNINKFKEINLTDICDEIYQKSKNEKISIEKCFEEFSKEEKLDRDNLWKCPNCNQSLQANKKIELYNTPKILIIHLKRFDNNKKINTLIDFPLTNLDLKKYLSNKNIVNHSKYNLFGVINHFGSLEYGHYTAFCKNYHDNNWYEYNDKFANKIPKENEKEIIVNENAYILFYREQKNDYIKWENIYNKKFENINENNLKAFGQDFIYEEKKINEMMENENTIKDEIKIDIEINKNKDNQIIIDDILGDSQKNDIDDDNFSFKEGASNIFEEDQRRKNNDIVDINLNLNLTEIQTPRFQNDNSINRIEEDIQKKNNKSVILDFTDENKKNILEQSFKSIDQEKNNINNNKDNNIYQTQIKPHYHNEHFSIFNTITKSTANVIRIKTFRRTRKNKPNNNNNNLSTEKKDDTITSDKKDDKIFNEEKKTDKSSSLNEKDEINLEKKNKNINSKSAGSDNVNKKNISSRNENDLLQYDIFNQSKNYFKNKLNERKKKPFNSVRSKELTTNFLLEEYSDSISDKVPRSKKLYEESNLDTENKSNTFLTFNKEKENNYKNNEDKMISIKEEESDNLKNVNINDIDLEDFVYNPFRNCYTKTRKF